jgi:GT2 family glycosyltransferase
MSGTREAIRVSVVITTYNRRRLVCEAIDSVLRQHHPNTEIIVIDDGSTDGTAAVLAERYGDRIICLEQANQGFGAARNRGVATATGSYIAFLDSDDIWLDGKLALQLEVMERLPELAYCFSDFVIFNDAGRYDRQGLQTWFPVSTSWDELLPRRERVFAEQLPGDRPGGEVSVFVGALYRPLLSQCYVLPTTAMVRASCIDERVRHTENDPICADWDFSRCCRRVTRAGSSTRRRRSIAAMTMRCG